MKLKIGQIEVEGDSREDIEWLLEKVRELQPSMPNFASIAGGNGGGRGRKEIFIQFPESEFTVPDLARELNISTACLSMRLKTMQDAGDAEIVGTVREIGQRGRATNKWKIINFPKAETEMFNGSGINLDDVAEDSD